MTTHPSALEALHFHEDDSQHRSTSGLFLSEPGSAIGIAERDKLLEPDALHRAIGRIFVEPPPEHLDIPGRMQDKDFQAEINDPLYKFEPELGVRYRIYSLNRRYHGVEPLVVYLGWGSLARNKAGKTYLAAFSQLIRRPIVTIDPLGYGGSIQQKSGPEWGFSELAESNALVLEEMGIDEMYIGGSSFGGVMAARLAMKKREKARALVTVGTPGIGGPLCELSKVGIISEVRNFFKADKASKGNKGKKGEKSDPNELTRLRNLRLTFKYGRELLWTDLGELPYQLSDATRWVNVLGSADRFTDLEGQQEAARVRDARAPGKTVLHVLEGVGHFGSLSRENIARVVEAALFGVELGD